MASVLPMSAQTKHSFKHPPLTETVLGVQFKRLDKLTNGHLGLFWAGIKDQWPFASDAPLLPMEHEQFESESPWSNLGRVHLNFTQESSSRLRLRNKTKSRMLQVQNGRFHYNWIKAEDAYPRYHNICPEFLEGFKNFSEFLSANDLGAPIADQWEITYINHIPKDSVWQTSRDWPTLFKGIPLLATEKVKTETFLLQMAFEIPKKLGRLHMKLHHGFFKESKDAAAKKEMLRMEFTARGPITEKGLEAGLTLGHDAIVETFVSGTSDDAKKFWGYNGNH